jgi:hypothetical protein
MTQLSLLNPMRPQAAPKAPEQAKQAARVGRGIDGDVMAAARIYVGLGEGPLSDITRSVQARVAMRGKTCAPDSPRRRLSALVAAGLVGARCVDRSRSLWVVDWVREGREGEALR